MVVCVALCAKSNAVRRTYKFLAEVSVIKYNTNLIKVQTIKVQT